MSKVLEEKKNDLIVRAESVIAKAKDEKRELTDEETKELEGIKGEVDRIRSTIKLEEEFNSMKEMEKKADNEPKEEKKEMAEEKRSAEEQARAIEEQDRATFEAYIRGAVLNERANNMEKGANGAVIPQTIANKIIRRVYDICPILEKSNKYNVKGTLTVPYYDESVTAITVGYQTEFSAITSAVGKFTNQITLTGYLAGALAKVSRSLINNSQFNIVDHVIDIMAEHISRFIEGQLLNGYASVGAAAGVTGLSNLSNAITADAQNAITADEVIKLHDSIKDRFQSGAMWIMSPKTRTALRLLKDEMGRYLLQDDISAPFGTTLLGKPIYVSDNMSDIGAGKSVIYYGDFKGLATKFNENINIQVLREKYADEHADGIIGWFEFDSKVENAQMMAVLKMANA